MASAWKHIWLLIFFVLFASRQKGQKKNSNDGCVQMGVAKPAFCLKNPHNNQLNFNNLKVSCIEGFSSRRRNEYLKFNKL